MVFEVSIGDGRGNSEIVASAKSFEKLSIEIRLGVWAVACAGRIRDQISIRAKSFAHMRESRCLLSVF